MAESVVVLPLPGRAGDQDEPVLFPADFAKDRRQPERAERMGTSPACGASPPSSGRAGGRHSRESGRRRRGVGAIARAAREQLAQKARIVAHDIQRDLLRLVSAEASSAGSKRTGRSSPSLSTCSGRPGGKDEIGDARVRSEHRLEDGVELGPAHGQRGEERRLSLPNRPAGSSGRRGTSAYRSHFS